MTAPALQATRGDTLTATFTLAYDITGWTPRWVAKSAQDWPNALDAAAVLTATTGSGLTSYPGATSTILLSIAASVMAAIALGTYVWDLQLTSGVLVRTVEWDTQGTTTGVLTVDADVTRTTP